jgi:hypothetical protein
MYTREERLKKRLDHDVEGGANNILVDNGFEQVADRLCDQLGVRTFGDLGFVRNLRIDGLTLTNMQKKIMKVLCLVCRDETEHNFETVVSFKTTALESE